jgi:hypothetical protein
MEDEDERIRDELSQDYLNRTKENALLMFDSVDSFVAPSQDNTSVHLVELYPFNSDTGNYELWDKGGQSDRGKSHGADPHAQYSFSSLYRF